MDRARRAGRRWFLTGTHETEFMNAIRVFIVDDSAVSRRLVTESFVGLPAIEIVGSAPDGHLALERIAGLDPDLVTLDVEMPGMDGVATLSAIRAIYPRVKVIMLSALTERGAQVTIDALSRGAVDYITKPASAGNWSAAVQQLRAQLADKLKPHFPTVFGGPNAASLSTVKRVHARPATPTRADIVAIGVSTGGPNALKAVLADLPADFPVPIVIVQHMPPLFTRHLAERLAASTRFPIREAAGDETLEPATAWLAPGDFHMRVERDGFDIRLRLNQSEPVNSCRPSVDVLFRSVVEVYGSHVLSVVLTGMGNDGLEGSKQVHAAGGQILAQDENTSVVWGMPGVVVGAGLANHVLPLEQIARGILSCVQVGRPASTSGKISRE